VARVNRQDGRFLMVFVTDQDIYRLVPRYFL
jgi:hypothetical protein